MTDTAKEIYQANDGFFHKIFDTPENARDFMEKVLPEKLKKRLDLTKIKVEDTKYVSNQFKKGYSDIVVKASLKTKKGKKKPVDIYFIIEHKMEGRVEIFIQMLKYMVFEWEKDYNSKKKPRIIIPVVFYHGADKWSVPRSFVEQFEVDDEVKPFLLDYSYILFDTNSWDFRAENNKDLKSNVYLFTAMVLLKAAYTSDWDAVREIFSFWHASGISEETEIFLFYLEYISKTQDISHDKLKKILDESKIDGGVIMPTLAQRYKQEFEEEFLATKGPQLRKEGRNEGRKDEKIATAKNLLQKGFDLATIMDITGLKKSEIEKLAPKPTSH